MWTHCNPGRRSGLLWFSLALLGSDAPAPRPAEEKKKEAGGLVALPAEVPAPKDNPGSPAKVALGKQLFFDTRLSGDNTLSCASCHIPEKDFADGLALGKGAGGRKLGRHIPTVLNAGLHRVLLWDGRAASLEEQALLVIQSPEEMNQGIAELERELDAVPGYAGQFRAVFGTTATRDAIARALAAFERTLVTRPSPLDRYLGGDKSALSEDAAEGLRLFTGEAGCIRCHGGPLLSDGEFHRVGVGAGDKGRGGVTGKREDDYAFRTPSLRNVARTAPYMHDGSLKTLSEVVTFYYRNVPGRGADDLPLDIEPLTGRSFSEIALIVAFLESLSGDPADASQPKLP